MTAFGYTTTSNIDGGSHYEYLAYQADWKLFRDIMRGGYSFKKQYVQRFKGETTAEWNDRLDMTPNAAFARAAIVDVRNAIYQRLDTVRRHGSPMYEKVMGGGVGGVDLRGSTMNYFMGMNILTELVFMGKVGIYVDSPASDVPREYRSMKDDQGKHPFMYPYVAEDIVDWEYYLKDNELKLRRLRLRVVQDQKDALRSYFPLHGVVGYRTYEVTPDGVYLRLEQADEKGKQEIRWEGLLEIEEIPFVIIEMDAPLLTDIAYHQIALTNLESADVNYAYRSNTIVYVEEYDPLGMDEVQNSGMMEEALDEDAVTGQDPSRGGDNPNVVKIGGTEGRRVPKGLKYPAFINPSSQPLQASREKQEDLKRDIRALINLAVSNAQARFASAESKQMDNAGLESGLAAIGYMIEQAEREVGHHWRQYAGGPRVTVKYPVRYSVRTDEERRKEAESLITMSNAVPSKTFRVESFKEAATTMFAAKVSDETLDKILVEVESSEWPTANPDQIKVDVEAGLVSKSGASKARGYPEGEAEAAKKEQKERDAAKMDEQVAKFNASARGVDDDPEGAKAEKKKSQSPENNDGVRRVRGEDGGSRKQRKDNRTGEMK
jgi:hypothetical protein